MGHVTCGLVTQPIAGESVCGDHHVLIEHDDFVIAAVADGLGHGPLAQEPAHLAIAYIAAHPHLHPVKLLEGCHLALRGTRGAALAIVRIERSRPVLIHAALGNVETHLVTSERIRHPVSTGGIVGAQARKFRSEDFPFAPGDMLIMHSDGLSDRMRLEPALRFREPQALAFQLAHEYGRAHDDQLVLIVRVEP